MLQRFRIRLLICLAALTLGVATLVSAAEVGGLQFQDPEGWKSTPKPMRAANYVIPAASGDDRDGEMAVYYFGPGQGGGVESNVRRWLGQFVKADGSPMTAADATRTDKQVNGMSVTLLDVTGTYLFKPFPMAPKATPLSGYRMLAAIVAGPDAPIFFKLTAPRSTADGAADTFHAIIASLKR